MSAQEEGAKEQDKYLPIANIARIMKKALPPNAKVAKDAKETVQECVSEFISFITSEVRIWEGEKERRCRRKRSVAVGHVFLFPSRFSFSFSFSFSFDLSFLLSLSSLFVFSSLCVFSVCSNPTNKLCPSWSSRDDPKKPTKNKTKRRRTSASARSARRSTATTCSGRSRPWGSSATWTR